MTDYEYECVKVRVQNGIAWTALNRPEKRNAMSPQLHYDMDAALARLEVDDNAKVVVVTGEGGNFSAGQDLKKFFRELEKNPGEAGIFLETAHPVKFPDVVEQFTGVSIQKPNIVQSLFNREKKSVKMQPDYSVFRELLLRTQV